MHLVTEAMEPLFARHCPGQEIAKDEWLTVRITYAMYMNQESISMASRHCAQMG